MSELRVLIVEDNPDDADLLRIRLAQAGFEIVDECVETESGYLRALDKNPGIIFSDYSLPQFSGLRALEILKESRKDIPFILISGTVGEEVAVESMRLGATDYMLKDNTVRLASAVKRALTEKKMRMEQAEALAQLRNSEERFREVVENIREVFWIFDVRENRVIYVSPAYERIWGRVPEALYQKTSDWLAAIHEDDRARVAERNLQDLSHGKYNEIYRIVRPDGSVRWVHDRSFPIRDASNEIRRIVGIAEDITERRELEEQLRQSQKMEAIGQLAGGVAHDFNNILQVILMEIDLGLNRAPQDGTRQMLLAIREAAERASNLTRQLLAFGRRQVMQLRYLDINTGLRQIVKMLKRIVGEHIELSLSLHRDPLVAHIDQAMIDQVVMNLVVNARDAMPAGGKIEIRTQYLKNEHPQNAPAAEYAVIQVCDTGSGINPEILPHIFEPFFTTKESGKGTGLGLATVFGIVQQHQGKVRIQKTDANGTTIEVLLPLAENTVNEEPLKERKPMRGSAGILLVEDEANVRKLNRTVLERNGYRVFEAADGVEAIRIFNQSREKIRVLFTDIVMPNGINGHELAAMLTAQNPNLIVILTTGYSPEVAGNDFRLEPGQNFLQKPYESEALLRILERSLQK